MHAIGLALLLLFIAGCGAGSNSGVSPNTPSAGGPNYGPSPSPTGAASYYHGIFPPVGPIFELEKFGADPRGMTSSSMALRTAAASCARAGGGVITAGPGRFVFDTALSDLPSNCWIEGTGRDLTTFSVMPGVQIGAIVYQTAPATNIGIEGVTFDCNRVSRVSALQFMNASNSQIIVRHNRFVHASGIWSVVIGGVSEPGSPAETTDGSQFIDNAVQGNASGTLEAAIFVSWTNGVIAFNQFENNAANCCSPAAALYAYSNNDIVTQNAFHNPSMYGDFSVQQAENISVTLNQHTAGTESRTLTRIVNSQHVDISGDVYDLTASPGAVAVGVVDFSGPLFDNHPVAFSDSADIVIEHSKFSGGYVGVLIPENSAPGHNTAQKRIIVANNSSVGSPFANLIVVNGLNATGISDIQIINNQIASGVWASNGGISLVNGNANATNIRVNQNTIGFSPGANAHAIDVLGTFPNVYLQNNNLSSWSTTNAILTSGGPTIIANGNIFSP